MIAGEIATALSIPVSSLSYLLGTLVERRYLSRDRRQYVAGPGLARLQADDRSFSLAERVPPLGRSLRIALDETASFFVWREWQVEAAADPLRANDGAAGKRRGIEATPTRLQDAGRIAIGAG